MKKLTRLFLSITIFVLVMNPSSVYSQQEVNLPAISIQPSMTYYPVKRLYEKFYESLQFGTEAKEKYYNELVQKRLSELRYVVDKDYLDQVEKSSQRFSYQVGYLTDYIIQKKLDNKKQAVADLYKKDKVLLEKLRDKYPSNTSFWMLIQHNINSIDINLQKL